MGEGALRGKVGVLVTEWRVTFLDALHKDSSPQSLAAHQRVLFSWRKRKQYGPVWSSLVKLLCLEMSMKNYLNVPKCPMQLSISKGEGEPTRAE